MMQDEIARAEAQADKVGQNLPGLEAAWARRAGEFSEEHLNFLKRTPRNATKVTFTTVDDQVYADFRETFPDFKVDVIDEDVMKSDAGKEKWRPFCNKYNGKCEDFNFATLLRVDAKKEYDPDNTILAPRVQFWAIEIARVREGANADIMAPAAEDPETRDKHYYMRVCAVCGKEAEYRCSRCKLTRYCSAACQRGHWKTHKKECE